MNRPAKVTQGEIAHPGWRYLEKHKTRHGRTVWYVRRGHGPRVRVPGEPGMPEFRATYMAIVKGEPPKALPVADPPKKQGEGFVYFLRVGDVIKIGFSTEPNGRLSALRTGLPGHVRMYLVVPGTMRTERTLHAALSEFRLNGEWFKASPTVMKAIARYATVGKVRLK